MQTVTAEQTPAPPLVSIFILSATALAYEVLLVRLFSIIHWHHFAFMVISIALLGYGASGSLITVLRERLLADYDRVFVINAVLFGLSAVACFVIAQQLPFNALEILWDSSQWLRLMLSYLLLTLPFFFVANAIALTLMRYDQHIPLVYGIDLVGAGVGAVLIMLMLLVLPPDSVLRLLGVAGVASGIFMVRHMSAGKRGQALALIALSMAALVSLPQHWLDLSMSEYKGLSGALLIKGAERKLQHSSPISMIDVVESEQIPFRNAPGLSLRSTATLPQQMAVFRDGDEMTTIDRYDYPASLRYLDDMSNALPYHLHTDPQRVLVLASATGTQLLQAHANGVSSIDAVEADGELSALISDDYADYFGWPHLRDKTRLHTTTPRSYAASVDSRYDLIVMGPPGGSSGAAAGVHAMAASYDYTIEAIRSYLQRLEPEGLLSITTWTSNPARGSLRLLVTAAAAMRQSGIDDPGQHIAWIRSWNTATLILKPSPLTPREIASVRTFSAARSFDLAWLPDISEAEANRYQLLQEPVFYRLARSLFDDSTQGLGQGQTFVQNYKYDIHASTDDSPYFDNFFKWSSMTELMSLPGGAGISLLGVGYPTLLITLAQAVLAATLLILLPLVLVKQDKSGTGRRGNIIIYFLAIGLAFLFIELAFIQKFGLIIGQPLYAIAVVLSGFLVFSGLGSLYVEKRMRAGTGGQAILRGAVSTIVITTLLYVLLLPLLTDAIMSLNELMRFVLAFIVTAPVAFAMGMPFPVGLAAIQQDNPRWTPWAWGINGCASVISAILAILLATEIGFSGVMLCAALLYLVAWLKRI